MALPELAVMQQTFELLHQLDPQARRRVLKWVKAALDEVFSAESSPFVDGCVAILRGSKISLGTLLYEMDFEGGHLLCVTLPF